jgi:drug/metabolite transporter (DMT)-like permease
LKKLIEKKDCSSSAKRRRTGTSFLVFLRAYSNIYVIAAVVLTIVTAFAWMQAVSKTEISYIYPFMALSYLVVAVFSLWIFHENVTILRLPGMAVICLGVFLVARR